MSTIAQIRKGEVFAGMEPPNLREIQRGEGGDGSGRLRRYRLGLALFLASTGMLFVGFSSAYVVRRGIPTYDSGSGAYSLAWEPLQLPLRLLLVNTLLLLAASFAAEVARKEARTALRPEARGIKRDRGSRWMYLAAVLAAGFLVGQIAAWHRLRLDGHLLTAGAHTAFYYVITAVHGFHALLGLTAAGWIALRARLWSTPTRTVWTDIAAWYLHSMAVLWIYLFAFLVFA